MVGVRKGWEQTSAHSIHCRIAGSDETPTLDRANLEIKTMLTQDSSFKIVDRDTVQVLPRLHPFYHKATGRFQLQDQ